VMRVTRLEQHDVELLAVIARDKDHEATEKNSDEKNQGVFLLTCYLGAG
jgi:hypothetical protein